MQPESWLTRIFECHPNRMNNCKMLNRTQSRMISQSKSVHKQFWRHFFLFFPFCFVSLSLYSFDQCVARYFEMSATLNARLITYDRLTQCTITHSHSHFYIHIQTCIGNWYLSKHVLAVNRQFINSIEFSMTLKWLNSFVIFQMFPLDVYRKR